MHSEKYLGIEKRLVKEFSTDFLVISVERLFLKRTLPFFHRYFAQFPNYIKLTRERISLRKINQELSRRICRE